MAERRRIGQVAERDLHADALGAETPRVAHQAADGLPRGRQPAQEGGADEPRGAGEEEHARKSQDLP